MMIMMVLITKSAVTIIIVIIVPYIRVVLPASRLENFAESEQKHDMNMRIAQGKDKDQVMPNKKKPTTPTKTSGPDPQNHTVSFQPFSVRIGRVYPLNPLKLHGYRSSGSDKAAFFLGKNQQVIERINETYYIYYRYI